MYAYYYYLLIHMCTNIMRLSPTTTALQRLYPGYIPRALRSRSKLHQ